jgi:hypothetical protein
LNAGHGAGPIESEKARKEKKKRRKKDTPAVQGFSRTVEQHHISTREITATDSERGNFFVFNSSGRCSLN